jgi:hypothetical protein
MPGIASKKNLSCAVSEEIPYSFLIEAGSALTYLLSASGAGSGTFVAKSKFYKGCQGFAGHSPSTFLDKFVFLKNVEQIYRKM